VEHRHRHPGQRRKGAGQARLTDHESRYAAAEEFLDFVYALWEGSWADDALVPDRRTRTYTRPDRVRRIFHHGAHYDLDAIHLVHPSPQRTPFLFQAGASPVRASRMAAETQRVSSDVARPRSGWSGFATTSSATTTLVR
jgi:alkanesulfonate monooxygenase SsuD/methylene tetrahydromethanopterin reductase-like flavin-dependent oxidoreductase (luciferase family)